jgi:hypothetical protein
MLAQAALGCPQVARPAPPQRTISARPRVAPLMRRPFVLLVAFDQAAFAAALIARAGAAAALDAVPHV